MSYAEKDGQVVLTMSREDYDIMLMALGAFTAYSYDRERILALVNRLNEGNPNWMPYVLTPQSG